MYGPGGEVLSRKRRGASRMASHGPWRIGGRHPCGADCRQQARYRADHPVLRRTCPPTPGARSYGRCLITTARTGSTSLALCPISDWLRSV